MLKRLSLTVFMVTAVSAAALAASYRTIGSVEAKAILDKGKAFLLDVRTPQEYQQARLAGAVLIPVYEIERRIGEIPRNRPIVVYCAVGTRSNLVAGYLAEKGYREVYNMGDGIVGWFRNGYPLAR